MQFLTESRGSISFKNLTAPDVFVAAHLWGFGEQGGWECSAGLDSEPNMVDACFSQHWPNRTKCNVDGLQLTASLT
jgi:hypothetical protein